jgi:hypothetical protein
MLTNSAALYGEIILKQGQVEQDNFDSYRLVTLAQMLPLDVPVLANGTKPGGFGEEGPSSGNLTALKKADSWSQVYFIEKGGWATVTGPNPPTVTAMAQACALLLTGA